MRGTYFNSHVLMPRIMMLMKMTTRDSCSFICVDAYKLILMVMTTMGSCSFICVDAKEKYADDNDYHRQLLEHMDGQVSPSGDEAAAERYKGADFFSSADLHRHPSILLSSNPSTLL